MTHICGSKIDEAICSSLCHPYVYPLFLSEGKKKERRGGLGDGSQRYIHLIDGLLVHKYKKGVLERPRGKAASVAGQDCSQLLNIDLALFF